MSFEVNGLSQGHGKPGFNVHSGLALTCEGNNDLLIVSRSSFTLLVIIFRLLLLFNGLKQYVWGKTKKTWLNSLPILQFQFACAIFFRRIIKKCCVFIIPLLSYENESLFPEHFFFFLPQISWHGDTWLLCCTIWTIFSSEPKGWSLNRGKIKYVFQP